MQRERAHVARPFGKEASCRRLFWQRGVMPTQCMPYVHPQTHVSAQIGRIFLLAYYENQAIYRRFKRTELRHRLSTQMRMGLRSSERPRRRASPSPMGHAWHRHDQCASARFSGRQSWCVHHTGIRSIVSTIRTVVRNTRCDRRCLITVFRCNGDSFH